ncbi:hypothetical protein GCM10009416_13150 [Craurococcus roseus]|uniref:Uncharacterized protein n=1 Tax=Craurococcus roseus TaxID=77585 RepID=A0ABN1EVT2_9PROT
MPLPKAKPRELPDGERLARRVPKLFEGMTVWRWDPDAGRWSQLPCGPLEWRLYSMAGWPLPGARPGPMHAALLTPREEDPAAIEFLVFRYDVLDAEGRSVGVPSPDPALEARLTELSLLRRPTPEEEDESFRIQEELWRPFAPTLEMRRRLLADAGERFDLSAQRDRLLREP